MASLVLAGATVNCSLMLCGGLWVDFFTLYFPSDGRWSRDLGLYTASDDQTCKGTSIWWPWLKGLPAVPLSLRFLAGRAGAVHLAGLYYHPREEGYLTEAMGSGLYGKESRGLLALRGGWMTCLNNYADWPKSDAAGLRIKCGYSWCRAKGPLSWMWGPANECGAVSRVEQLLVISLCPAFVRLRDIQDSLENLQLTVHNQHSSCNIAECPQNPHPRHPNSSQSSLIPLYPYFILILLL